MALFKRDYNKPGPGVPKNAPRKKGFPRFFELLARDFGNLVKLNIIYQLCLLPAQLFFIAAFFTIGSVWFLVFVILGMASGVLVGPAKTAMEHAVSKMLRDDPGFIWHDFKRIFKENFKGTALPGVFFTMIVAAQIIAFLIYFTGDGIGIVWVALYLFSLLLFSMASPYFFLQASYLELGTGGILKNSLLLAIGYVPRSLAGALLSTGLVVVQLLVFPFAIPVTFVVGYTIPALINLMWIWPPVDKTFEIEKTLKERDSDRDYSNDGEENADGESDVEALEIGSVDDEESATDDNNDVEESDADE